MIQNNIESEEMNEDNISVLLIEDNPGDANLVIQQLEESKVAQFHIEHVALLADGLEKLSAGEIEIVLLDLSLPDSQGMETFSTVHSAFPEVPVIMLTGQDDEEMAIEAAKKGAQDYLHKGNMDSSLLIRSISYAIERRQAQKELRKQERYLRTLAENSTHAFSIIGIDGTEFYRSPNYERVLGFVAEEHTSQSILDNIHPDDAVKVSEELTMLFSDLGSVTCLDVRVREHDGSWRWIEMTGNNDLTNSEAAWIVLNFRDITDRKQADKEIAKQHDSLKEYSELLETAIAETNETQVQLMAAYDSLERSEEAFRLIFEASPEAIVLLNPDGSIKDTNNRIMDWLGYNQSEVKGKNPLELPILTEESKTLAIEIYLRSMAGEEVPSYELSFMTKDGQERIGLVMYKPVSDSRGEKLYDLLVIADITKRKKAELELERALNEVRQSNEEREILYIELEEKAKEMEQIIYVTSHDLRSPLVNIQGFTGELDNSIKELASIMQKEDISREALAKLDPIINEDIPEAIGFIKASTPKMESLLNGLLKVSRAGRTAPNIESLDMNSMLSDILNSFAHVMRETGTKYEIDNLPPCVGDVDQINQVFSNIVGNALKYLEPERPGLIMITGQEEDEHVIFCIKDNGRGVAAEQQERIFQMFHRVDPESTSGEGLGLTIIKKILNQHHGKIWLESEYNVGSKFYISLPNKELSHY